MEKYKAVIYSAFVTYPLLVNIPVWYILPLYIIYICICNNELYIYINCK